ncbi:hypothetical protein M1141_01070 [Candidatus Marsarchaeota archaeon]|nr:hypothetical protein [Candidatus Marsarchaeota archaeon]
MITIVDDRKIMLSKREQLIILEIGYDEITSASSFVDYISNMYGVSKSSVWYSLNNLKEKEIVDFATKDHPGHTLVLTKSGVSELGRIKMHGPEIIRFFEARDEEARKYLKSSEVGLARDTISINISI